MPRVQRYRADKAELTKQILSRLPLVGLDKKHLASKMGMPIRTLNMKLSTGYWTYEELWSVFHITQMPQDTIAELFR